MGVSTTSNRASFTGNGVTTAFSFPYKFLLEEDLVVVKRLISTGAETVQTLTTHYTTTGEGEDSGGTVTMLAAPSALYELIIYNDPDLTQEVNLEENDSSPAEVQEGALDKLTLLCQRLANRISRAVRLSDGFAPTFDMTFPVDLDDSADKVPLVNGDGDGWADAADWPTAGDIADAEENAVAAAASAAAALASETAAGVSEDAAAVSAAAAQTAVDSIIWRDVVFKTFADSPITLVDADRGKLFVISTAGGAVTVNLPAIAGLTLTDPWAVGLKKSTGDVNAITVARASTDTINGATSATIDTSGGGLILIPDTDPAPDEWTSQAFGAVDDGSITTAKLNDSVFHGLTAVTPAAGDSLAIADVSDSNKKKKVLVSLIRNAVYRSVTTTDPVGADDETMKLSGNSFTATLPTAVGVEGKRYKFIHAGTSLTQLYTIQTTSSQTIGGVAGGSYVLYTNGEVLWVESNGANWEIIGRVASSDWVDGGASTVTGTTTNPTKASGITVDKIYWRRQGKTAFFRLEYAQSNTTSAAAGSGDYLWAIPANMVMDTAKITPFTTVIGLAAATITNAIGAGNSRLNTLNNVTSVVLYDTTKVRHYFINPSNGGFICSTGGCGFDTANFSLCAEFSAPISGWQP